MPGHIHTKTNKKQKQQTKHNLQSRAQTNTLLLCPLLAIKSKRRWLQFDVWRPNNTLPFSNPIFRNEKLTVICFHKTVITNTKEKKWIDPWNKYLGNKLYIIEHLLNLNLILAWHRLKKKKKKTKAIFTIAGAHFSIALIFAGMKKYMHVDKCCAIVQPLQSQ